MHKKQSLIALFIFLITICSNAEVTRTITIGNSMLDQIRMSLDPTSSSFDVLLHYAQLRYSEVYIPDNYTPPPTPPPILKPEDYNSILDSAGYLKAALFAGTPNDQNVLLNSQIESRLNRLSTCIFMEGYFRNVGVDGPRRALDLIYLTVNTAMLYDCLYYENTNISQTSKDALKHTLEKCIELMEETECYFYELAGNPISDSKAYWQVGYEGGTLSNYPSFVLHQYRFGMYASLGLAAILLYKSAILEGQTGQAQTMLNWVNFVDGKLQNEMLPLVFPLSVQSDNMIDFHTTKSGAYMENPSYLIQLLGEIVPYFLARKRIDTADLPSYNYFDDPQLISWVNDISMKIVPSLDEWPYNDTRYATSGNPQLNPGPAVFYHNSNSASSTIMDNLSWYYQGKSSALSTGFITCGQVIGNGFQVIYSSNPDIPLANKILNRNIAIPIPAHGSISNSEFTILRKQTTSSITDAANGLINDPAMYVVHESGFSGGHGHADQTSFTFYHKGKYFLIDPGYIPYNPTNTRKWSVSPYGHNMVIVKPDLIREDNTLDRVTQDLDEYNSYQFRPRGAFRYYSRTSVSESMIVEDPCEKDYFQKSNDLDILRLKLTYDDTNFPTEHPE